MFHVMAGQYLYFAKRRTSSFELLIGLPEELALHFTLVVGGVLGRGDGVDFGHKLLRLAV